MAVDVQRNRILATSVLKQAETLADNGTVSDTATKCALILCTKYIPLGKLPEAQKALTDAITKLETSLSRDHEFCKVL